MLTSGVLAQRLMKKMPIVTVVAEAIENLAIDLFPVRGSVVSLGITLTDQVEKATPEELRNLELLELTNKQKIGRGSNAV